MKHKIEAKIYSRPREGDAHRAIMASSRKGIPLSSTIRFLGILKQPDSVAGYDDPFELDEGDIVWSSSGLQPNSPPRAPNSRTHHHHQQQYRAADNKSGLSAALAGDAHMVRRKSALNPSLSAVSAARNIAPVSLHRPSETLPVSAAPKFPQSAPINVPVWRKSVGEYEMRQFEDTWGVDDDDDEDEEEMIPPHEMVARSQMTTFSVFEGVGRTLKGRDLRRVRNAVFQQTGFID